MLRSGSTDSKSISFHTDSINIVAPGKQANDRPDWVPHSSQTSPLLGPVDPEDLTIEFGELEQLIMQVHLCSFLSLSAYGMCQRVLPLQGSDCAAMPVCQMWRMLLIVPAFCKARCCYAGKAVCGIAC